MCLDNKYVSLSKYIVKEKQKLVGWKVFYKDNRSKLNLRFEFMLGILKVNKWLNSSKYKQDNNKYLYCNITRSKYKPGFHFYLSEYEANLHCDRSDDHDKITKKIYFKDPIAFGYQNRLRVGVAKKIFICK